jgi:hypothetical protein
MGDEVENQNRHPNKETRGSRVYTFKMASLFLCGFLFNQLRTYMHIYYICMCVFGLRSIHKVIINMLVLLSSSLKPSS